MMKLRRRQALELGTAAAIVGPSVLFSRTSSAADKSVAHALREQSYKVNVEYFEDLTAHKIRQTNVPGVVAVDLGGATFANKATPQYAPVSLTLAPKQEAAALARTFKKALAGGHKHKAGAAYMKISVSLYGEGGRKPALTYHVLDAVPQSASHDKLKQHKLQWNVGKIERVTHKIGEMTGKLTRLPRDHFKVDIEGVTVGAAKRVTRYSWSADKGLRGAELAPDQNLNKAWSAPQKIKVELGANKSSIARKPTARAGKVEYDRHLYKLDAAALKLGDQVAVSTFVTAGHLANKVKGGLFEGWPAKWKGFTMGVKGQGAKNSLAVKVKLRSVQFPRLEAGSKALVTETFHYALEPGGR